ncbi:MAG: glycosyltransferase family 4 protein [Saprospiraceae bacterium]|nr:glycosyltransferase family 4 protein [Saprospiraceae bacterium]
MAKQKVLLYGPVVAAMEGAYGGGTGGYTRKMGLYLQHFRSETMEFVPSFHTVRGQYRFGFFVVRFFLDLFIFVRDLLRYRPAAVHLLGQYRSAIPREFIVVLLCRLARKPVVYEIKAGVFVEWYQGTNPLFRAMTDFCLRRAALVLCQGRPYVHFLRKQLGIESRYHPNFVPVEEIPDDPGEKLTGEALRVLFVGYAFHDKGVFELVEGCRLAASSTPVELTLVGHEHSDFTKWMDAISPTAGLRVTRKGRLPHEEALEEYRRSDVYCYPTRHRGEGHNNSINEAMMMGLIIVTTRQGFMDTILDEDTACFLPEISPQAIAGALLDISLHREEYRRRSAKVREHLLANFTSEIVFGRLEQHYRRLFGLPAPVEKLNEPTNS